MKPQIPYCTECGLPLVRSPGGFATCPNMHGKLRQCDVWKSVWLTRLVQSGIDVRTIEEAEKTNKVGPRGGKGKVIYKINGRIFRRTKYTRPLDETILAFAGKRIVALAPEE